MKEENLKKLLSSKINNKEFREMSSEFGEMIAKIYQKGFTVGLDVANDFKEYECKQYRSIITKIATYVAFEEDKNDKSENYNNELGLVLKQVKNIICNDK